MNKSLNLELQVIPNTDRLSRAFFSSKKEVVIENLFAPTRRTFQEGLGIPIEVSTNEYGQFPRGDILISYTTREEFDRRTEIISEFNMIRAFYLSFSKRDFPGAELNWRKVLGHSRENNIFIFSGLPKMFALRYPKERTDLEKYCTFQGHVLLHELGHTFGLEHASYRDIRQGTTDIMSQGSSYDCYKWGRYDFSKEDKERIAKRMSEGWSDKK
ncbi:MAG: hypothetical protein Q8R18_03445 [bacterium]|nr:hypothetical protein [bacterium]